MTGEGSSKPGYIRPLALGIVWRGDEILVFEGYDRFKGETFYRPLGGGIQFGERSQEALRREFREEVGSELASVCYLDTLENIFVSNGRDGHEIVMVYEASLADRSFYERETFEIHEENAVFIARWMPLHRFQTDGLPLYPDGLLELLTGRDVTR